MMTFLLWLILFVLCWPLALAALVLYPLVWLLLLPFRIVGISSGRRAGTGLGDRHPPCAPAACALAGCGKRHVADRSVSYCKHWRRDRSRARKQRFPSFFAAC